MHGTPPVARRPRDQTLRAMFVASMAADLASLRAPGTVADAGDSLALVLGGERIGTVPDDTSAEALAAFLHIADRISSRRSR